MLLAGVRILLAAYNNNQISQIRTCVVVHPEMTNDAFYSGTTKGLERLENVIKADYMENIIHTRRL